MRSCRASRGAIGRRSEGRVHRPIGIFDSGVGGLSVLREIRKALPAEDLLYVADSGHAPYGDKSPEFIAARALRIASFFDAAGVKAIVVACNTVTGVAVEQLRARFRVPIVAIEPAIKPAVERTRSGVVGVLGTSRTIAGANVARLIAAHAGKVRVLLQACPGLVDQVERGELSGARTEALVRDYVTRLVGEGADTLVLGCTHYPFLEDVLRSAAGPGVAVLDPAPAVARELRRRLGASVRAASPLATGTERYFTTGSAEQVAPVASLLLRRPIRIESLPSELGAQSC